jgi:drug/metabolite transporter (DMT)-like permease
MKSKAINRARSFGFLGGLMLAMAAAGVFWLITPMAHPDATALQSLLVIVQVVVGTVLAVWCWVAAGRVGIVEKEDVGASTEKS